MGTLLGTATLPHLLERATLGGRVVVATTSPHLTSPLASRHTAVIPPASDHYQNLPQSYQDSV